MRLTRVPAVAGTTTGGAVGRQFHGAAAIEDDGIPFETKMTELSQTLYGQMEESAKLDDVIQKNLEDLGYGK